MESQAACSAILNAGRAVGEGFGAKRAENLTGTTVVEQNMCCQHLFDKATAEQSIQFLQESFRPNAIFYDSAVN